MSAFYGAHRPERLGSPGLNSLLGNRRIEGDSPKNKVWIQSWTIYVKHKDWTIKEKATKMSIK